MPWVKDHECDYEIPEDIIEFGDKTKGYYCPCGNGFIYWEEDKPYDKEDYPKEEDEGIPLEKVSSMKWFVAGSQILCETCANKVKEAKPVKLASVEGVECAKCGAKPLEVKKGAIVFFKSERKIYCPECAKAHEANILAKATFVASLEDEDIVPTPLWCDECGKAIPAVVSKEVITTLHKTIDGLEAIIYDERIRQVRPSLWRKALAWKEKLDDYILAVKERLQENLRNKR